MATSLVDQINDGFKRLYAKRADKPEYNDEFATTCNDNGFEEDDAIEEELNASLDESQLADEDFLEGLCPWIEGDDRTKKIFAIIKKCYKDPNAFSANKGEPLKVLEKHFDVTESEKTRACEEIKQYAPAVFDSGFANDKVLSAMLAVQTKTGKPYLLFLVDMFLREQVYHRYNNKNVKGAPKWDVPEWAKSNNHIQKDLENITIKGTNQSASTMAIASVKSYLHRVAPKLMMHPTNRIVGDLRTVATYIESTIEFVFKLATQNMDSCPFQYDSVFAFEKSEAAEEEVDDDDDDDDDDDGGGDFEEKSGPTESALPSNVKSKLKECNLVNESVAWDANYVPASGAKDRGVPRKVMDQLGNKLKIQAYPQNHRFCSVVDFRKNPSGGNDEEKEENFFMFQPLDGTNEVDGNHALKYFHNIKKSIVPDEAKDDKEDQLLNASTNGPQIILSFHVDSADSMRCYLYINGQHSRFFPPDIKMVLPQFLVADKRNTDFLAGDEIDEMIVRMEDKLIDVDFQAFLNQHKVQCAWRKEYDAKPKK